MKKAIKMVALVGDQEVVVGQCHPGQARILRKNGMAEWDKDKLVLKQAVGRQILTTALEEESEWGRWTPPGYRPETFAKEVRFSGPEEQWGEAGDLREALRLLSKTEERESEDLKSWVEELHSRKSQGHTVYSCDDPRSLKLGFMDYDDGIWFKLALRKVKMASDETLEALGINRDVFSSSEGREELIGGWDFLKMPEVEGVEVPEGMTLESIWAEEVRERNQKDSEDIVDQDFAFLKGALVVVVRGEISGLEIEGQDGAPLNENNKDPH